MAKFLQTAREARFKRSTGKADRTKAAEFHEWIETHHQHQKMHFAHRIAEEKIDAIWARTAASLGFSVVRTRDCYASSNGRGVIQIGARDTLDDDDSLAQLVFHELCHALVQGEANLSRPDWGLDNTNNDDLEREHACLRIQAVLADAHGLRAFMTPTTVVRDYYLGLPSDALSGGDEGATLAQQTVATPLFRKWRAPLLSALAATAHQLKNSDETRAAAHATSGHERT